jgi:hypothetical protein
MARKKTGTTVEKPPFMEELETAQKRLENTLTNYSSVLRDDALGIKMWEKNVLLAEEYLAHPKCSSREHGINLRTIAIKQYNMAVETLNMHVERRKELSTRHAEVKKAIASLQPKAKTDFLHRLAYLENASTLKLEADSETQLAISPTAEKEIQQTLFNVEALLSLQEEMVNV